MVLGNDLKVVRRAKEECEEQPTFWRSFQQKLEPVKNLHPYRPPLSIQARKLPANSRREKKGGKKRSIKFKK